MVCCYLHPLSLAIFLSYEEEEVNQAFSLTWLFSRSVWVRELNPLKTSLFPPLQLLLAFDRMRIEKLCMQLRPSHGALLKLPPLSLSLSVRADLPQLQWRANFSLPPRFSHSISVVPKTHFYIIYAKRKESHEVMYRALSHSWVSAFSLPFLSSLFPWTALGSVRHTHSDNAFSSRWTQETLENGKVNANNWRQIHKKGLLTLVSTMLTSK